MQTACQVLVFGFVSVVVCLFVCLITTDMLWQFVQRASAEQDISLLPDATSLPEASH